MGDRQVSSNFRPIRVLLVDDQVLFLHGLANVLSDWPDVEVLGQATDGLDAVTKAQRLHPDVVLMDINMPNMDGLEATKLLRREMPELKVVIITVSEQDENLFEAIKLGATGYLLKDIKPVVLHEMLLSVARGEAPISPAMASKILNEFARRLPPTTPPQPFGELTSREKEVLELVATGADNRAIADRLYLAPGTVKRHLHNILDKLQARSRDEAAAYALLHGLISLEPHN